MSSTSSTSSNSSTAINLTISFISLILYPVLFLLKTIFNVLTGIFLFVTLPLQYTYSITTYILSAVFGFLAHFESLYYYFSFAVIIGLLAGTVLYCTTFLIFKILSLDLVPSSAHEKKKAIGPAGAKDIGGRTAASYRAERAARQAETAREKVLVGGLRGGGLGMGSARLGKDSLGLLGTAIFEEGSEDDYRTM